MRRAVAVGLVLCLMIGAIVLVGLGPDIFPQTMFHYEQTISSDAEGSLAFGVYSFVDCEVEISILNDPELLYEVDLELRRHGDEGVDFKIVFDEINNHRTLAVHAEDSPDIARKITINVGNALQILTLGVRGHNLTSSILLTNSAILNGSTIFCDDIEDISGSLDLRVANSLRATGDVDFRIQRISTVNLIVNLPQNVSGGMTLSYVDSIDVSAGGWQYAPLPDGRPSYVTENMAETHFFFDIWECHSVVANLVAY
ncbi:MAG: hypothetical protein ACFFAX_02485 [Promethearchaeota archaeon]